MTSSKITPVIKWAGGKRQLIPVIKDMLPEHYNCYFEPFFGGGALFFDLQPKDAVINDFNVFLINMYVQIADNYPEVIKSLDELENKYNSCSTDKQRTDYYFKVREVFNTCIKSESLTPYSASLLIFLNKAGFNGLYRVNKNGEYNVPTAHRKSIKSYDFDNIKAVSKALSKTTILTGDFEKACRKVKKDDFVFFDSPYYETFDTYQAGGFSKDDHIRLFNLFNRLNDKGAYLMLTNNDCDFIKDLYKSYNIKQVPVKRMINCDGNKRTGNEVIITNY